VRSPKPRFAATSRATARIKCAIVGVPCISGSATRSSNTSANAPRTRYLMCQNGRRTIACGSSHLAQPYTDTVTRTARRELKPLVNPIRLTSEAVETMFTIQVIKIGADELAILHAKPRVIDQVRHASRWIDLIIRGGGSGSRRPSRVRAVAGPVPAG
jgi:hypothetical protein